MWYSFIRYAFFLIIFYIILIVLHKKQIKIKKWVWVLIVLAYFGCVSLAGLAPIENLFITFDSPQAALNYVGSGNREVLCTVEGEDSTAVIYYPKQNEYAYLFLKKTKEGWKINPFVKSYNKTSLEESIYYDANIYRLRNSDDCYIIVFMLGMSHSDITKEDVIITDNRGTSFQDYEMESDDGLLEVFYYAYVKGLDKEGYVLTINGQTFAF